MNIADLEKFTLIGKKLYEDKLWVSVYIKPGCMPVPYVRVTHLNGEVLVEDFLHDWVLPSDKIN